MKKSNPTLQDKLKRNSTGDLVIVILVLALCIFGIIMVFSASYYVSINEDGNPYSYLKKQIIWFGLGLVTMIIFSRIDYHIWGKFWILFYLIGLVLLVAVKIPGLGINVNGATRWIRMLNGKRPSECRSLKRKASNEARKKDSNLVRKKDSNRAKKTGKKQISLKTPGE